MGGGPYSRREGGGATRSARNLYHAERLGPDRLPGAPTVQYRHYPAGALGSPRKDHRPYSHAPCRRMLRGDGVEARLDVCPVVQSNR